MNVRNAPNLLLMAALKKRVLRGTRRITSGEAETSEKSASLDRIGWKPASYSGILPEGKTPLCEKYSFGGSLLKSIFRFRCTGRLWSTILPLGRRMDDLFQLAAKHPLVLLAAGIILAGRPEAER